MSKAKIDKGMITSNTFSRENQWYLIFNFETKLDNEKLMFNLTILIAELY